MGKSEEWWDGEKYGKLHSSSAPSTVKRFERIETLIKGLPDHRELSQLMYNYIRFIKSISSYENPRFYQRYDISSFKNSAVQEALFFTEGILLQKMRVG